MSSRESPDEAALVEAARSGDKPALEQLLYSHYDSVHAVCRRMLGNDSDAEDVAQESLISAVRALARFDGRSSFGTWMYRIATNACLDELRRRRRRPLVAYGSSAEPGGAPDPAGAVASKLDVDSALGALPPEFRAAVVLRDLCDMSYEEIAASLGVPVGTVRSRIARGRAQLCELLGNESAVPGVESEEPDLIER